MTACERPFLIQPHPNTMFVSTLKRAASRNLFAAKHLRNFAVIPFNLADIGEGIAEVEIMSWSVEEGESIEEFQDICEVQSDKATVTITSRYTGKITNVHYEVGDLAAVGAPLISIDVEGAIAEDASAKSSPSSPTPTPRKEPAVATPTPAPTPTKVESALPAAEQPSVSRTSSAPGGPVLATPAVRRLAGEHNVLLSDVVGSGKAGRVTKGDLLLHVGQIAKTKSSSSSSSSAASSSMSTAPSAAAAVAPGAIPPLRPFVVSAEGAASSEEPIRGISRMMVSSMKESLKIPHFGYNDEIEMDALMELRTDLKPIFERRGVKLSFMPMMLKAASLALADYPSLNSTVSGDEEMQSFRGAHNIGVAMDTPRGLLVPNVLHCESRSMFDIAYELNRLQAMGAQNKLGADELTGGTFTLSNIGTIGGTYASPVILPGQVAIGALGKFERLPRFNSQDEVVAKTLMKVSFSGDHRVIDGATMAHFSNAWKVRL